MRVQAAMVVPAAIAKRKVHYLQPADMTCVLVSPQTYTVLLNRMSVSSELNQLHSLQKLTHNSLDPIIEKPHNGL